MQSRIAIYGPHTQHVFYIMPKLNEFSSIKLKYVEGIQQVCTDVYRIIQCIYIYYVL